MLQVPSLPSFSQWLQIGKVLSNKEKRGLVLFFILFLGSSLYLSTNFFYKNTVVTAAAGGHHREGVMGQPRFINPIYVGNSDVDRDLVQLVFAGLMKYTPEGEVVLDLAKEVNVDEEGKIYRVILKDNVVWHDGEKLDARDVIFTIQTIQNPEYKSPLRANWIGVEIEEIEGSQGLGIEFRLEKPYIAFLERLTLKLIPQHIWQDIPAQSFPLSVFNLKPVGLGPYLVEEVKQTENGSIAMLELASFGKYFGKSPFIQKISFRFFKTDEELLRAAASGEVGGFSLPLSKEFDAGRQERFQEYSLVWPRYFAVFLNAGESRFLAEKEVRQALYYGTDLEKIKNEVVGDQGQLIHSPILPGIFGFALPSETFSFDQQTAESLLQDAGFEKKAEGLVKATREDFTEFTRDLEVESTGREVEALQECLSRDAEVYPEAKVTAYFGSQTKAAVIRFQEKYEEDILEPWGFTQGTGIVSRTTRAKLNEICGAPTEAEPIILTLTTVDDPALEQTAALLKTQWENLGIQVIVKTFPVSTLEKEVIKPRDYEALLFGEVLGAVPDLFPFWHSSQRKDPGLNLTDFESRTADGLLEEARTSLDKDAMKEKYEAFQDILIADTPAIFLYSPDYQYFVHKEIKGIEARFIVDPSKRFVGIEDWYIKTKRTWK